MDNSLKSFVEEFIQKKQIQQFPHLYIVDKQTGPYWSIQQAIDAALPNSTIKITQGFYQQNLIIDKPLRLQPKQNDESSKIGVVLLASEGIAVHIILPESDDECTLTGMKFSHSGNSANHLKKELLEHEHILNIFQKHQNTDQLENQFVNRMAPNKMESIIVLAERGKLNAHNCIFSLSYLVKSCNTTIPAIWIQKNAGLSLTDSEVKGHQTKNTIGIVCRLSNFSIQNSILSNHKEGALLAWGIKTNHCQVAKNYIEDNSLGIHLVGQQFKLKIVSNSIHRNTTGIKVGLASEPQISRNIIIQNNQGIQINSAFPLITLNKIQKNKSNGITCKSYKKFLCKAQIKKNISIVANGMNGIVIQGENNNSIVSNNHLIGFNGQAGVRIEKQAFSVISYNKIYKNHKQGVLVVENSSATIQKNQITHNIEVNIALGGKNSHHSAIIDNLIADSPGTGIYLIKTGRLKVIRNDITNNHDGIILTHSQPQIQRNHIHNNRNNGIICQHHSQPSITQNFITRNCGVGLLLRHGSCNLTTNQDSDSYPSKDKQSRLHSNIIVSNEIDSAIQEFDKQLLDNLQHSNTIEQEIYYPQGLACLLI